MKKSNPLLGSLSDSIKVNSVSITAEMLFCRLVSVADDAWRYNGDPATLGRKLLAIRREAGQLNNEDINDWLNELRTVGLVTTYWVGGERYLVINNPPKKLRLDTYPNIEFPSPWDIDARIESVPGIPEPAKDTAFIMHASPSHYSAEDVESAEPVPTPESRSLERHRQGFVRFWEAYPSCPRRQGKKQCALTWKRNRMEEIADKILDTLEVFKKSDDWTKEGGQYIPMPQTWLNRTPWESNMLDFASKPSAPNNGDGLCHEYRDASESDLEYYRSLRK